MLLVSLCASVITWLCNRAMRFQSRPKKLTHAHHRVPVALLLEHPTRTQRVVGSNPILGSDIFPVSPMLYYHEWKSELKMVYIILVLFYLEETNIHFHKFWLGPLTCKSMWHWLNLWNCEWVVDTLSLNYFANS